MNTAPEPVLEGWMRRLDAAARNGENREDAMGLATVIEWLAEIATGRVGTTRTLRLRADQGATLKETDTAAAACIALGWTARDDTGRLRLEPEGAAVLNATPTPEREREAIARFGALCATLAERDTERLRRIGIESAERFAHTSAKLGAHTESIVRALDDKRRFAEPTLFDAAEPAHETMFKWIEELLDNADTVAMEALDACEALAKHGLEIGCEAAMQLAAMARSTRAGPGHVAPGAVAERTANGERAVVRRFEERWQRWRRHGVVKSNDIDSERLAALRAHRAAHPGAGSVAPNHTDQRTLMNALAWALAPYEERWHAPIAAAHVTATRLDGREALADRIDLLALRCGAEPVARGAKRDESVQHR